MKHLAPLALALTLISGSSWSQSLQQKVFGLDTTAGDQFGISASIQGNRAVLGAMSQGFTYASRPGAAYVFERSAGSWAETARLSSPVPSNIEKFGSDVAVDGDRIVVGAYGSYLGGAAWTGAAYLFEKGPGGWAHTFTFLPADTAKDQLFGHDVDIQGDRVVIGAETDTNAAGYRAGAVYVFELVGGVWQETAKLISTTAGVNARLGVCLDLDGDRILAGAPLATTPERAFLFEYNQGTWTETHGFLGTGPVPAIGFGQSVTLEGSTAVIGAYAEDVIGWHTGAAYVFEEDALGWTQTQRLLAADMQVGAHFGRRLALDGDVLAISGHRENVPGAANAGRLHRFERDPAGWHELGTTIAADAVAELSLGQPIALSDGTLLAGAPMDSSIGVSLGLGNGTAYFTRFATLKTTPAELSLAVGGTATHALNLTAQHASELYILFGSTTGIAPGVALGAVELPLAVDAFTSALLPLAGSSAAPGYLGLLDTTGQATAQLVVPPGTSPALVGLTLYHAGLTLDALGNASAATNPTRIELLP